MVRDRGRIVYAIHFRYAKVSMLKARQVSADVDGSFGMAAILEDWLSTCTWPNYLIPVCGSRTSRPESQEGGCPPKHGIGEWRVSSIRVIGGCRGTPVLSVMKHVVVSRQGLWWITGSWRHQGLASQPAEPGLLYGAGRSCQRSQRKVGWPPSPCLLGSVHVPEGVADYTHPVCSGQGPNENAIGLRNCDRSGIGLPVLC